MKIKQFKPINPKMLSFEIVTGRKYSLLFVELFYYAIEIKLPFIKSK